MIKKIINKIKNLNKKEDYMNWGDYENRINFLDTFTWQQNIRKQSIKNTKFF